MGKLRLIFLPVVRTRTFYILNYVYILNPIALIFQLITILREGTAEGVSITMLVAFAVMQLITCINAIALENMPMLVAFLLSFIITLLIILFSYMVT
jgi:uncharacterized protein with PQ loop repeat